VPEKIILLKKPGSCVACATPLAVGSRAWFDFDSRALRCTSCEHVRAPQLDSFHHGLRAPASTRGQPPPARQGGHPETGRVSTSAARRGAGDPRWRQLVEYHASAARCADAPKPVPVESRRLWTALPITREEIVTGRGDHVRLTDELRRLFADDRPHQAVYYGWPLVVTTDDRGARQVAPLMLTRLQAPRVHDVDIVPDGLAFVNPGLLNQTAFAHTISGAAAEWLATGPPVGDSFAMSGWVTSILRLAHPHLTVVDPDALSGPPAGGSRAWTPGVHNVAVAFCAADTGSSRSLVAELEVLLDRDDWQQTAARWLLEPAGSEAALVPDLGGRAAAAELPAPSLPGLLLNDAQEQVVLAARTAALTVVTGPPGTGKSQLVAALVVDQWLRGERVLVASSNNEAVDVAVGRFAAIDAALLLRAGNAEARKALPGVLRALRDRAPDVHPSREVLDRQRDVAAAGRRQVIGRLADRAGLDTALAQSVVDAEKLRMSILGSQDTPAVHGQRRAIHRSARRVAAGGWLQGLRERWLLGRAGVSAAGVRAVDVAAWAAAEVHLDDLRAAERQAPPSDAARDSADLATTAAVWATACATALRAAVQDRLRAGKDALAVVTTMAQRGDPGALSHATTGAVRHALGWARTAKSLAANFALEPGLFDLLVVDEASQCTVAELLPMAYRARRVVVVGDPNQLRPVVTLDRSAVSAIARVVGTTEAATERANVSASKDSAYIAFAARVPGAIRTLDEHYRCHPEIARFVNDQFYGGELRPLTEPVPDGLVPQGLLLVDVPGRTDRDTPGQSTNAAEVEAIVAWVRDHHDRQGQLDGPGSIGVVTPFSAQKELLDTRLQQALGSDPNSSTMKVGTAHSFQGAECDIVLFSTVLARGASPGTVGWVEENRNLVNVAVSRARRALVVFADTTAIAAMPVPTLHALVDRARDLDGTGAAGDTRSTGGASSTGGAGSSGPAVGDPTELARPGAVHSDAEARLAQAMARCGLAFQLKALVDGYELDFAVGGPGGRFDVEVDGPQHLDLRGRQRRQDLARDRIVEARGWRVLRFSAWRCLSDPDDVAAEITQALHERETTAGGAAGGWFVRRP